MVSEVEAVEPVGTADLRQTEESGFLGLAGELLVLEGGDVVELVTVVVEFELKGEGLVPEVAVPPKSAVREAMFAETPPFDDLRLEFEAVGELDAETEVAGLGGGLEVAVTNELVETGEEAAAGVDAGEIGVGESSLGGTVRVVEYGRVGPVIGRPVPGVEAEVGSWEFFRVGLASPEELNAPEPDEPVGFAAGEDVGALADEETAVVDAGTVVEFGRDVWPLEYFRSLGSPLEFGSTCVFVDEAEEELAVEAEGEPALADVLFAFIEEAEEDLVRVDSFTIVMALIHSSIICCEGACIVNTFGPEC